MRRSTRAGRGAERGSAKRRGGNAAAFARAACMKRLRTVVLSLFMRSRSDVFSITGLRAAMAPRCAGLEGRTSTLAALTWRCVRLRNHASFVLQNLHAHARGAERDGPRALPGPHGVPRPFDLD